jgi:hypothetical protein
MSRQIQFLAVNGKHCAAFAMAEVAFSPRQICLGIFAYRYKRLPRWFQTASTISIECPQAALTIQ